VVSISDYTESSDWMTRTGKDLEGGSHKRNRPWRPIGL
jgi:hypothetical protein